MNTLDIENSQDDSVEEKRSPERTWRPLLFFNSYRLVLSGLFIWLYYSGPLPAPLGSYNPELFHKASMAIFGFSLIAMAGIIWKPIPFQWQLYTHVIIDIVLITLLMHASGGISSGLGMLLVISIANGSMLARNLIPGFMAALATIAVLLQQTYNILTQPQTDFSYPQAGVLGMTLFATALLTNALAKRARQSEALASQRSIDLANMAQLTDYIIQQMEDGVLTVDASGQIHQFNKAASRLLNPWPGKLPVSLEELSLPLAEEFNRWREDHSYRSTILYIDEAGHEIQPRFHAIGDDTLIGALIFLEDATETNRKAHQLKLASLGRLTASIAHEVRNPLGAISHATELLAESPALPAGDQRLTRIILDHTKRVNNIIESILRLGRSGSTKPENLLLIPWLEKFIADYVEMHQVQAGAISTTFDDQDIVVRFDPSNLQQILWNLFQNGLRHAAGSDSPVKLVLRTGYTDNDTVYIDVIDSGPGIDAQARGNVFEPFYTTDSRGTGLGLYISRELATTNHARLHYLPTVNGHSRFQLLLGAIHPPKEKIG